MQCLNFMGKTNDTPGTEKELMNGKWVSIVCWDKRRFVYEALCNIDRVNNIHTNFVPDNTTNLSV